MNSYADERYYSWVIVPKALNEPIGSIGIVKLDEKISMAHIGYCIGKAWWRQGYTSEALKAVVKFLFEDVGICRIESRHDPRNPNSGKVMEKASLKYEGTLKQADWNNQGICDASYYGLLAEDYQKISRFIADMLGSQDETKDIQIDWPDIIVEYMFLQFVNRNKEKLKTFSKICWSINYKAALTFLNKINDDFPYDLISSEILSSNRNISSIPINSLQNETIPSSFSRPSSRKEELDCINRMVNGHQNARNILVEHNLRLVTHIIFVSVAIRVISFADTGPLSHTMSMILSSLLNNFTVSKIKPPDYFSSLEVLFLNCYQIIAVNINV